MKTAPKASFDNAFSAFKAGRYEESIDACLEILRHQPNDTNVLQILGSAQYLSKQLREAEHTYVALSNKLPDNKEILNTYGCILRDQRKYADAIGVFTKALHIDASYFNAAVNLAYCYHASGQFDKAVVFYKEIVKLHPDKPEYLQNYADALFRLEKYEEAGEFYRNLIRKSPQSEQAFSRLAWCLFHEGKCEEAINILREATPRIPSPLLRLELAKLYFENRRVQQAHAVLVELATENNDDTTVLTKIGTVYYNHEQYLDAIETFQSILKHDPTHYDALNNLGVCYDHINDNENAISCFTRLVEAHPGRADSMTALGAVYQKIDDTKHAIDCYDKALAVDRTFVSALYNKGVALHESGFYAESSEYFLNALKYKPDHPDAAYNLGINYLAQGDLKNGFRYYFKRPRFPLETDRLTPITPGMDLSNKKVLFVRSQGIGDELFFLRFIHLVKTSTNKIFYRADPKIASLCQRIPSIDEVVERYPSESFDYCFEIDDLPLILDIQRPDQIPPPLPLTPMPEAVENVERLLGNNIHSPLMGLTWRAGSKKKQPNPNLNYQVLQKSIPLDTLADAVEGFNGKFVVLQRNPDEDEIEYLIHRFGERIIDLSAVNENLEEMLALLSLLDRYVGVSNTNMHLRAALRKCADVLVPYPPEWRWLRNNARSPWFPAFNVHPQTGDLNWDALSDLL